MNLQTVARPEFPLNEASTTDEPYSQQERGPVLINLRHHVSGGTELYACKAIRRAQRLPVRQTLPVRPRDGSLLRVRQCPSLQVQYSTTDFPRRPRRRRFAWWAAGNAVDGHRDSLT